MQIGVFLPSSAFVDSWLKNGVLRKIANAFPTQIIVPNASVDSLGGYLNLLESGRIHSVRYRDSFLIRASNKCRMVENRSKSRTFQFKMSYEWLGQHIMNLGPQANFYRLSFWMATWLKNPIKKSQDFLIKVISINPITRALLGLVASNLVELRAKDFKRVITESNIDVLLIPTITSQPYVDYLVRAAKESAVLSVVVIENWDNISSKTIFRELPDFVTVLGNQTLGHAVSIQGFDKDRVLPIGIPRFEEHFEEIVKQHEYKKGDQLNIAYLGLGPSHNEIQLMSRVVEALRNHHLNVPFQIHYRPHPSRSIRFSDFDLEDLPKEVVLDDTVHLNRRSFEPRVWKRIKSKNDEWMPKSKVASSTRLLQLFLANKHLVISTPTTALLDAMLLSKPIILDLTNDGKSRTTAASVEKWEHLHNLEALTNIRIGRNVDEIAKQISSFALGIDKCTNYFVQDIVQSETPFTENIVSFLEAIRDEI